MATVNEVVRMALVEAINAAPGSREALEASHGQVWSTDQLREEFEVTGFMAPFVAVRRKSDGKKGSMEFQHNPRFYYGFSAD